MVAKMSQKSVSLFDALFLVFSLLLWITAIVIDVILCVQYFIMEDYVWGAITCFFIVLPTVVTQLFSGRWHVVDKQTQSCCCWAQHLIPLQPMARFTSTMAYGLEARKGHPDALEKFYYEQNDVIMLRFFSAFLGSAPQVVLQSYIYFYNQNDQFGLTVASAAVALVAVSWSVAAYYHAQRKFYQEVTTNDIIGLTLQTFWQLALVSCRVMALVTFTGVFAYWVFAVLGGHWLIMLVCVLILKTDFCSTVWEERLFAAVVATIYTFIFFSVKEGHTRWHSLSFHSLMLVENAALLSSWFIFNDKPQTNADIVILAVAGALFLLGVILQAIYYCCFHPTNQLCCCIKAKEPEHHSQSTPASYRANHVQEVRERPKLVARHSFLQPHNPYSTSTLKHMIGNNNLSPISSPQPTIASHQSKEDLSWAAGSSSMYRHFTIDATAGIVSPSDRGYHDDIEQTRHEQVSQPKTMTSLNFDDVFDALNLQRKEAETLNSCDDTSLDISKFLEKTPFFVSKCINDSLVNTDESHVLNTELPSEKFSLVNFFDPEESGDVTLSMCNSCGKTLPFIDQSIASLSSTNQSFTHCRCSLICETPQTGEIS